MAEFEINGIKYQSGKLNAFQAWDVVADFGDVLVVMAQRKKTGEPLERAPIVLAMAALSDRTTQEGRRKAAMTCLSVVSRQQQGGGWAPVVGSSGTIMFDDIANSLPDMLWVAWKVMEDNGLADFFYVPDQASPPPPAT